MTIFKSVKGGPKATKCESHCPGSRCVPRRPPGSPGPSAPRGAEHRVQLWGLTPVAEPARDQATAHPRPRTQVQPGCQLGLQRRGGTRGPLTGRGVAALSWLLGTSPHFPSHPGSPDGAPRPPIPLHGSLGSSLPTDHTGYLSLLILPEKSVPPPTPQRFSVSSLGGHRAH